MNISITDSEREFLLELLEARHKSMLHELHHTDTHDYKRLLAGKVDLLESVRDKLKNSPSTDITDNY
jgi:TnpA family transposase